MTLNLLKRVSGEIPRQTKCWTLIASGLQDRFSSFEILAKWFLLIGWQVGVFWNNFNPPLAFGVAIHLNFWSQPNGVRIQNCAGVWELVRIHSFPLLPTLINSTVEHYEYFNGKLLMGNTCFKHLSYVKDGAGERRYDDGTCDKERQCR